jgi:hypothetical protein
MAWSYTGNPADRDIDAVRFLVADTDEFNPQVLDEEITWALTHGSVYRAASVIACQLASQYSVSGVDKKVGDLEISNSQLVSNYQAMCSRLKAQAGIYALTGTGGTGGSGSAFYAGGISETDRDIDETDTDRSKPSFKRNIHENTQIFNDDEGSLS